MAHMCHSMCIEVRGQLLGVISFLSPCSCQGLNSGHLGLVASKCLYLLSHIAGLSPLLFDALVSFGLTERLEKPFIYINRFAL